MEIAQIIQELRCNDVRRRLRVAEAAADALELLEERIAIMSENLTAQEWDAQQEEARRRVRGQHD